MTPRLDVRARPSRCAPAALVVLAALVAGCAESSPSSEPRSELAPTSQGQSATVESVTDGDTLRTRDGSRVRLVQIDAPEAAPDRAECGGATASRALRGELAPGTRVTLSRDRATDDADQHGRLLRYVIADGRNLNLWMVEQGHAAPYFFRGVRGRFAQGLQRAAQRARSKRIGLWGECPRATLDPFRGIDPGPRR